MVLSSETWSVFACFINGCLCVCFFFGENDALFCFHRERFCTRLWNHSRLWGSGHLPNQKRWKMGPGARKSVPGCLHRYGIAQWCINRGVALIWPHLHRHPQTPPQRLRSVLLVSYVEREGQHHWRPRDVTFHWPDSSTCRHWVSTIREQISLFSKAPVLSQHLSLLAGHMSLNNTLPTYL